MLFLFGGAPRMGSNLQMFIVTHAMQQAGLGYHHIGKHIFDAGREWEVEDALGVFSRMPEELLVVKGHLGTARMRDLILAHPNVRVFQIWRDLRDALSSHYHYRRDKFGDPYRSFAA